MATNVQDLITQAQNYASDVLSTANSQLNLAMSVANGLGRTVGGPDFPVFNIDPPEPGDPGSVPQYQGTAFQDPGLNTTAPELTIVPDLDLGGEPGGVPQITAFVDPGTRPVGDPGDPALLQNTPDIDPDSLIIEPAPNLLEEIRGITKPRITAITVRPAPSYVPPPFTGVSPDAVASAPTNLDAYYRSAYATIAPVMRDQVVAQVDAFIDAEFPSFRTGLAAIEGRLDTYLAGGTALTAEVQDAIYGRATTKSDTEYRRARDTLYLEGARMGHTVIGASLVAKAAEIDNARRDGNAQVARDLMVKMAEMEQQNLQFAVAQSASLRGVMINGALNYYSGLVQINGQALEYARSLVDSIVKSYEAAVRYSEIQARIYEAEARIYDSRVKGALGVLDAYTAYVRGLEAQSNLDTARVNVYKVQIEAVQAQAQVYRAQMEGVTAQATLARLQVDIFQARVQAYATQVNAWTAQWNGYEAAVKGEMASVAASVEQVKGYAAASENYRTIINARTAAVDGITKRNDGLLRQYTASVEAYRVRVMALAEVDRALIASYDVTLKAFVAKSNAISEKSRAEIAQYMAALEAVKSSAETSFRLLHETHDLDIHRVDALSNLSAAAAKNYAALAQAAMSGMNTLVASTIAA